MSMSHIFKCISCRSPGMTGICGIGDVYGHMRFLDLDDEAIRHGLFGWSQGVVSVRVDHPLLDWGNWSVVGSGKFQLSIAEAVQSVSTEVTLLSSIGALIGVSVMIVRVCCHGSASSFPSIQEGMLSMGGSVKFWIGMNVNSLSWTGRGALGWFLWNSLIFSGVFLTWEAGSHVHSCHSWVSKPFH